MNLILARRAGVAALGLLVAVYLIIAWMMVSAAVVAEHEAVEANPGDYGMAFEDVNFSPRMPDERADDDPITLKGWWIPAVHDDVSEPSAIIVVHGLDSNRAREPEAYMPFLRDLHDEGFSLLLFDLRAHGQSGGEITSAGYYERYDVLGAMDTATSRFGVPPERIGVLGWSLGGVAALLAATEEPRLEALVIDSAFANIDDLFAAEVADRTPLPAWSVGALRPGMEIVARMRYGIRLSDLKPERFVDQLDFPILFTHSEDDDRIPIEHSERILDAATHPQTELIRFSGSGHSRAFEAHPEAFLQAVSEYFRGRFDEASP